MARMGLIENRYCPLFAGPGQLRRMLRGWFVEVQFEDLRECRTKHTSPKRNF